jgi:hypothetical protein
VSNVTVPLFTVTSSAAASGTGKRGVSTASTAGDDAVASDFAVVVDVIIVVAFVSAPSEDSAAATSERAAGVAAAVAVVGFYTIIHRKSDSPEGKKKAIYCIDTKHTNGRKYLPVAASTASFGFFFR